MTVLTENVSTQIINIDTGDTVLHHPTGEGWLVACVIDGHLSWCGYPEGTARLADCSLIKKATASKKDELLSELAAMSGNDHRGQYARKVLTEAAKNVAIAQQLTACGAL
jgi:hypothetical protein